MLTLFSPAKVNLFLRVLGKRPDGYHEIASLFQAIDLGDRIEFTLTHEDALTSSHPTLSLDSSNLIMKALNLFRKKSGLGFSIKIYLEKNIPMEAGLGGGSSNAATTLWALNFLHGSPYSEEELQSWASEIGSDVPFFFSEGTAYCTGRGEKVKNMPFTLLSECTIKKPEEGVSTQEIYQSLELAECSLSSPEQLLENFYAGKAQYVNDLEVSALRACPRLGAFKKELLKQYSEVFMTGSGTAYICLGQGKISSIFRQPNTWYSLKNIID